MLNFDQRSLFLRKSQKTRFLPLFVRNKLKIDKNSKNFILNCFLDVKHPIGCCVFSCLRFFCQFFEFHAKWGKKLNFLPNFPIFDLIWHVITKISKTSQKRENATSNGMFYIQKEIQNKFLEFLSIFNLFRPKSGKKRVFFVCDFLKNGDFWSKFNITNVFLVKFPF